MLSCRGGRGLLVHLLFLQGKSGPWQESSETVSFRPRRPDCGGGDGGGGGGGEGGGGGGKGGGADVVEVVLVLVGHPTNQ